MMEWLAKLFSQRRAPANLAPEQVRISETQRCVLLTVKTPGRPLGVLLPPAEARALAFALWALARQAEVGQPADA